MSDNEKNMLLITAIQTLKEYKNILADQLWQTDQLPTPVSMIQYRRLVETHAKIQAALKILDN